MKTRLLALLGVGLLTACPATPGVTCRTHDDCKSLADGYCARAEICTRECTTAGDCPEASACVDVGRRQVCLPTCESDAGCPFRFGCRAAGAVSVCQVDRPFDPATR